MVQTVPTSWRAGLACLALAAGACSSATPAATAPGEAAAAPPSVEPATAAAAPPPADPPAAARAKAKKPESVQDCRDLAQTSQEGDPGAAAPGSAPEAKEKSDRLAPMQEFIRVKRPGFRCCFDIWAGKIPEARLYTKVTFVMDLDPGGKLKKATVKPEPDGPLVAKEVETCLADVAGTLTYPKSASGMDTTYTHRFDFKPRR